MLHQGDGYQALKDIWSFMDPHNEAVVTSLPHENDFYFDIYFGKQALLQPIQLHVVIVLHSC